MSSNKITVGSYLLQRLYQLGVRGVHGVPGDFNLTFLDLVPENGLSWVGNCNELNAAYASDGYARIKGISALITTFGVGELSALAGVAGSYSEHVPIVHIVGVPNTASQKDGLLLHHTLGNGNFRVFSDMSKNISEAWTILDEKARYAEEIDRVLSICWVKARPVYIALPTDIAFRNIDPMPLSTPLELEIPPNAEDVEDEVVLEILDLLYNAKNPVILSDACAIRHRVLDELHQLILKTRLPTFVAPMGKGSVNETLDVFGGVYIGDCSRPDVKAKVEHADLVLYIGGLKSDFNSGGFTFHIERNKTVEFHSDHMKVRYAEFPGITMKYVLRKLISRIDVPRIKRTEPTELSNVIPHTELQTASQEILHAWFWPRIGQWLKPYDIIITETGTANFGILETRFPEGVTHISQVLWGSIGYSVGATQGAGLANKETQANRRLVLFVGEGSLQLTVQEISTMIKHDLKPIIFVLNNEGYTIERLIHGAEAPYNDVWQWKYTQLLDMFNAKYGKSFKVTTKTEMESLLKDEGFSSARMIQLVEVIMPKMDAPRALKVTAEITAKLNAQLARQGASSKGARR